MPADCAVAPRCRSRHGASESVWPECGSPWPSEKRRRRSAERPVRNAATRAGEASFASLSGGKTPSFFAIGILGANILVSFLVGFLGEFKRTGIDFATRPAGHFDRMRNRILDAVAF